MTTKKGFPNMAKSNGPQPGARQGVVKEGEAGGGCGVAGERRGQGWVLGVSQRPLTCQVPINPTLSGPTHKTMCARREQRPSPLARLREIQRLDSFQRPQEAVYAVPSRRALCLQRDCGKKPRLLVFEGRVQRRYMSMTAGSSR